MCSNVLKRDQEKGSETSGAGQEPGGVLKQHWASQLALTQQACHATPSGRRVGTRLQGGARRARAGQQLRQLRFTLGRGHGNQTQQQALHAKVALRREGTAGAGRGEGQCILNKMGNMPEQPIHLLAAGAVEGWGVAFQAGVKPEIAGSDCRQQIQPTAWNRSDCTTHPPKSAPTRTPESTGRVR